MRIALANPSFKIELGSKYEKYYIRCGSRWPHSGVKRKGDLPHYLPFPFFLAYSAALLRENGFSVKVIDAIALDMAEDEFLEIVKQMEPHLILYETTTPTINYDLKLSSKLKKILPSCYIALAGPHVTIYGQEILSANPSIDFILKGEYEFTLLELVQALKDAKKIPRGVIYCEGKKIIDTGYAELIDPLDRLPFPARDIFPSNDEPNPLIYWDGFCQGYPAIQMHSSRGCPYKCYFCLWNQVIYRNGKYRTFSAQRVVDEMEEVVREYHPKEIYFDDDDFTIRKTHVLAICDEIRKRKLKVNWSCMADIINLDEEMLTAMAHAGCIGIKFGIESADPDILKKIGKPINLSKVKPLINLCSKLGIKTHASFTLGLLEENAIKIRHTIKYASELALNSIQLSIATPYPGTEFFKIVKNKGYLRTEEWHKFDGKVSEIVSYPWLDWKQVEKLRRKEMLKWYLKNLFSFHKLKYQLKIVSRTIKNIGIRRFFHILRATLIDELKNR